MNHGIMDVELFNPETKETKRCQIVRNGYLPLTKRQEDIVKLIKAYPGISRDTLSRMLKISVQDVERAISFLDGRGILVGEDNDTYEFYRDMRNE